MEDLEQEIDRIDQGGEAWTDTDEEVVVEAKRPLDIVVPVRFSSETWETLRQEAREVGFGPSTLVRMWILEKLKERTTIRRSA